MKTKKNAFTLVEIILVLALIGIVTTAAYSVFFAGQKSFEVGIDKGQEQADHRILREYITNELRNVTKIYFNEPSEGVLKKYSSLSIEGSVPMEKYLSIKNDGNTKKIPVYFQEISMENDGNIIRVKYKPTNSKSEYEFTIGLENVVSLGDIELLTYEKDGEDDKLTLYYAYPQDIK